MAGSQQGMCAIIPLAALAMLLFIGSADATACAAGYKDCDKNYKSNKCEINVHTDVNNCGDCGIKCPTYPYSTSTCKSGKCVFTCKAGWKNCNNRWSDGCEIDVGKDINNCGACGAKCKATIPWATTKCNNHRCEYTCKAGWKDCNKDLMKDGCEVDVGKDVNNCGACGAKCKTVANASTKCSNHKCMYTCNAGWKNCNNDWTDGCETEVRKNVNNCGGCGTKCSGVVPWATSKCSNGNCEYTCKAGWKDCNNDMTDGCEIDVGKDNNNCGGCGTKCNILIPYASTKCNNYKCETICKAGWKDCNHDLKDGCETDVGKDVHNCGGCGTKCSLAVPYASTKCTNYECEYTCKAGWKDCNKDLKDGCEIDVGKDVNNCGDCGVKCDEAPNASTKCSNGKCEHTCEEGWANCNGDWADGCEVQVASDVGNCGACGMKCDDVPYATTTCSDHRCEYTCEEGWANCNGDWADGCEANLSNDVDNCGECETICPKPKFFGGEAKCSDGACEEKWCVKGMKFSSEKRCCVEDWWPFSLGGHGV